MNKNATGAVKDRKKKERVNCSNEFFPTPLSFSFSTNPLSYRYIVKAPTLGKKVLREIESVR